MPVATDDALTGLGVPAQLAALLGAQPKVLTCAGTSQATAATILSRGSELSTGASTYAAIAPTDAPIMTPFALTNQTATSAVVYPPVGHYLNSVQNAGVTVAQYKSVYLWQYKAKYWTYILTA